MTLTAPLISIGFRVPWWVYLLALVAILLAVGGVFLFSRAPMDRRSPEVELADGSDPTTSSDAARWQPPTREPGPPLPTRPRHQYGLLTPQDRLLGQRYLRMNGSPRPHARPEPPGAGSEQTVG